MDLISLILTFSILAGQLIRLPVGNYGGLTLLDGVVGAICLIGLYKTRLKFQKFPLFFKAAFAFIIICMISIIFTPLNLTLTEKLSSFFYTVRFSSYIFLGFLIYQNVFPQLSKNISKLLITSGFILSILGILQFIFLHDLGFLASSGWDGHILRSVSTFLDPNFLGGFLTLTLILLIQKYDLPKKWRILIFAVIYLCILLTFSRSSYLMFIVSFLTISFFKHSLKFAIISILLFAGLLGGFRIYEILVAQPRNIDRVQSAKYRIDSWQQGLVLYQMHPVLGVGYNTYRYALMDYQLAPQQFIDSHGASANDSSLLHVAATTGTIGFMAYLLFLFSLISDDFKKNYNKKSGGIMAAALLGLIIHSTFANSLFYPFTLIWLALLFKIYED